MAESKPSFRVFTEPRGQIEQEGKIIFDGIFLKPEQLNMKIQFLYSVVDHAHVNEAVPHIHDFPVIMSFIGTNPQNIYDFDAEIEFTVDGQKQVITKASTVAVQPGTAHCPLIFKRIGKPVVFLEMMLTDNYARRYPKQS